MVRTLLGGSKNILWINSKLTKRKESPVSFFTSPDQPCWINRRIKAISGNRLRKISGSDSDASRDDFFARHPHKEIFLNLQTLIIKRAKRLVTLPPAIQVDQKLVILFLDARVRARTYRYISKRSIEGAWARKEVDRCFATSEKAVRRASAFHETREGSSPAPHAISEFFVRNSTLIAQIIIRPIWISTQPICNMEFFPSRSHFYLGEILSNNK